MRGVKADGYWVCLLPLCRRDTATARVKRSCVYTQCLSCSDIKQGRSPFTSGPHTAGGVRTSWTVLGVLVVLAGVVNQLI